MKRFLLLISSLVLGGPLHAELPADLMDAVRPALQMDNGLWSNSRAQEQLLLRQLLSRLGTRGPKKLETPLSAMVKKSALQKAAPEAPVAAPKPEPTIVKQLTFPLASPAVWELQGGGILMRAPQGSSVRAVLAGKVAFVGWITGLGQTVILEHPHSYYSVYAHLEKAKFEVGQKVNAGDEIATVGSTDSENGPQLYFELRQKERPLKLRQSMFKPL